MLPLFPIQPRFVRDRKVWALVVEEPLCQHIAHTEKRTEQNLTNKL